MLRRDGIIRALCHELAGRFHTVKSAGPVVAQRALFGLAGYGAPAYLTLAEAAWICAPMDRPAIDNALKASLGAAHNVQDGTFCAHITARCHGMREHSWRGDMMDVSALAQRLRRTPGAPEFSALHRVGEAYEMRNERGSLKLPAEMRKAATLRQLADVYQRPLDDFLRQNRDRDWSADTVLPEGNWVRVPDPGFAPLLAAPLAAEAIARPDLSQESRRDVLRSLVPVAMLHPTQLDTVLSRLLLVDPPMDPAALDTLLRLLPAEGLVAHAHGKYAGHVSEALIQDPTHALDPQAARSRDHRTF